MASLAKISDVLLNLYNNGRVKVTDMTLDARDMQEYAQMAYANIMRQLWLALQKKEIDEENYFFSSILDVKTFDVSKWNGKQPRHIDLSGVPIIRLPQNTHIFEVTPRSGGQCEVDEKPLVPVQPGEEKFYTGPDYSGFQFASVRGDRVLLYNLPECIEKVDVTATYVQTDSEIPDDIAWDVVKEILKTVFGVREFGMNKVDDNSNKLSEELKQRLGIAVPQ